ncbi:MAG: putative transport system permease protein [Solirubrobacteraceae bacterium]|jgi:putative ABC transport system permease protein|nr:putative transport system permease protein [Solirubrobacteraceae bacterium]
MLRLAVLSSRGRLGTFTGALIALIASSALVMAGAMPLEAALRTHPPVERYAATAAVVTGQQTVGAEHDVPLGERARVSSALTARLAAVPGVRAAIADASAPARLGGRATVAHGWASAALTPYALTAGRPPARPDEVVTGYRAALGARLRLASTEAARTVTVVGVAAPRHAVRQRTAIFLTDSEAVRLAGHPGQVDAIGVLAAPGFDASRLRAAGRGAVVLTGDARGRAEYPELEQAKTTLIAVTASFGGLALFIAIFVVASTMGLSIQQREREIALLRAVAATPGQIRRMIAWEAAIVGLVGSAAGIWPGAMLGRELAHGLVRHGIAPPNLTVNAGWLPIAAAVGGGVMAALLAVLAAGRRAARVPPTHALANAAVEPRLLGPGRVIGGLIALAGAAPLFAVSTTTGSPDTAAATSEMTALFLVAAVGFLGPIAARFAAALLGPPLARLSPVGGFLASANLRTATRRFSSASTPLVLTVAMSCTLLFSSTTQDHAVTQQRHAGLSGELAITGSGGVPPATLADARATPGVRSAVALTPTTLGPGLGISDETIPAAILDGGQGGGLDAGVTAGSLAHLHGNTIALGRRRAEAAHAGVGDRVAVMLGDGTRTHATVVAIYTRALAFGDALLAPELAARHQASPLLGTILVQTGRPATVARRLRALAPRYPGLRVSDRASLASATDADRETNRWLGPLFVAIIFGFTSIAVVNTLTMIALQRGRELALLRLVGGTPGQVRSMARWEAVLIVTIGLGLGLAIAATALLPLSHALTGSLRPTVPLDQLGAILGVSALLALLALGLPTRRALRSRPVEAIGVGE